VGVQVDRWAWLNKHNCSINGEYQKKEERQLFGLCAELVLLHVKRRFRETQAAGEMRRFLPVGLPGHVKVQSRIL